MRTPPFRMSRLRRTVAKALCTALAVVLSLGLAAPAALAAGVVTGSGVGGNGTSGLNTTGTTSACGPNGNGYLAGELFYVAPFPRCYDPSTIYLGDSQVCQVGFEVFRFYSYEGSNGNPGKPLASTVSDVNLPQYCGPQPQENQYAFISPNPADAGSPPPLGSPWHLSQGPAADSKPGSPTVNYWTSSVTRNGQQLITTSMPFVDNGSCTSLVNPNPPLAQALRSSNKPEVAKAKAWVTSNYNNYQPTWGSAIAATIVDAQSVSGSNSIQGFGSQPTCGSGVQFQQPVTSKQTIVYGTCFIPLRAQVIQFKSQSGQNEWGFLNGGPLGNTDPGTLVRYSQQDGRGIGYSAWRTAMYNERLSRGTAPTGASFPTQMHFPSADFTNAAAGTGPTASDVQAAAQTLADYSHCVEGANPIAQAPSSSIPTPTTTTTTPPTTTVPAPPTTTPTTVKVSGDINVTGPQIGQIGGTLRPMNFSVDATNILDKVAMYTGGQLTRLTYRLTFTGTNGYSQSEWVETSPPNTVYPLQFQEQAQIAAYRATMPNQFLNVRLTGVVVSATYQVQVPQTYYVHVRVTKIVKGKKVHTTRIEARTRMIWVTHPLTLTPTYTYDGAYFNPSVGKNLKVIGTTAIP